MISSSSILYLVAATVLSTSFGDVSKIHERGNFAWSGFEYDTNHDLRFSLSSLAEIDLFTVTYNERLERSVQKLSQRLISSPHGVGESVRSPVADLAEIERLERLE